MDFSDFFEPLDLADFNYAGEQGPFRMGDLIKSYTEKNNFPDPEGADLVILGVKEDRDSLNNEGCALAPDFVRKHLYSLYPGAFRPKIVDLGNIKAGFTIRDTYFAVASVLGEILEKNIIPIIIGG
ncbi:MAG: arginase family protein, partial [Syntrophothermus sp.]